MVPTSDAETLTDAKLFVLIRIWFVSTEGSKLHLKPGLRFEVDVKAG